MNGDIFVVQPQWCRAPLPVKQDYHWLGFETEQEKVTIRTVLEFDPTELYDRVHNKLNPFVRYHNVGMNALFPSIQFHCACGCGSRLTGRQRRWAAGHSETAIAIAWIIAGRSQVVLKFLRYYYGRSGCMECSSTNFEVDHTWPVKFGGGNCWLSNYKLLCNVCHRRKTNSDFGWKKGGTSEEMIRQLSLYP